MVTIEEIAKLSNCSISTVSKALNGYSDISEKTKKKIIKIANELGYVPNATAQSLVRRRSNTIGIVYEVEYGLKNLFFSSILESFRKNIEKNGHDLLFLSNNIGNGMDYLRHCRSKHVDGVLVVSAGSDQESIKKLIDSEIAVLRLDPDIDVNNSIYSDSYNSIQTACKYLYDNNHRRIAFIHGDRGNFIGGTRLNSYLDFVKSHDLEVLFYESLYNHSYSFEEGYNTMKLIYDKYGLPDGVVASSDLMAVGAMAFIHDMGYSIPEDISIIGFDNIQLCEIVKPKLSTIGQNFELIGEKACEILLHMVENKNEIVEPFVVDTKLIIRDSCHSRLE